MILVQIILRRTGHQIRRGAPNPSARVHERTGLTHYYEVGQMESEHAICRKKGITVAGDAL